MLSRIFITLTSGSSTTPTTFFPTSRIPSKTKISWNRLSSLPVKGSGLCGVILWFIMICCGISYHTQINGERSGNRRGTQSKREKIGDQNTRPKEWDNKIFGIKLDYFDNVYLGSLENKTIKNLVKSTNYSIPTVERYGSRRSTPSKRESTRSKE